MSANLATRLRTGHSPVGQRRTKTGRRIALLAQWSVKIPANDIKIRNVAPTHALQCSASPKQISAVWRAHPRTGLCRLWQEDVDRPEDPEDVADPLQPVPTKPGRLASPPSVEGRPAGNCEQAHLFRFAKMPRVGDTEKRPQGWSAKVAGSFFGSRLFNRHGCPVVHSSCSVACRWLGVIGTAGHPSHFLVDQALECAAARKAFQSASAST